jgi:hypothetical protein
MNKMAIFVEGYTEVLFVDKLIREIANKDAVQIEWRAISGGARHPRKSRVINAANPRTGQEHFVLIFNCGNDDLVKSRMVEEYGNLASAGYSKIVCIRDVYPKIKYAEIAKLEMGLPTCVKTKPIMVDFILSIMEVEAWFLAEHSHFARIDPTITIAAIIAGLNFDPENDDMQLRAAPCDDLRGCYALAGKTYEKANAKETVDALDCAQVYAGLTDKFPYLKKLVEALDAFLRA